MKRVCKDVKTECEKASLWKAILKAQYPGFPPEEARNCEYAVKELLQGYPPPESPNISDFEFVFTMYVKGEKIGTERLTFQGNARSQVRNESLKAYLLRVFRCRSEIDVDPELRCYIILRRQGASQIRECPMEFLDDSWLCEYD